MRASDVAAALRGLDVAEAYRESAARNLEAWWNGRRWAAFQPQLESLAARAQWPLLLDSFYRPMPFGTGGRRGPVGIGPNRLNHDTVATSVQGHVHHMRRRFPGEALRVVVAYDVRVFRDLRGLYDPAVPNPLLGVRSLDFARLACAVYAVNGVEVYTVPGDDGFFLSTPELSFAIRRLRAHGGLNVSASHNHPDDNGVKFFLPSGGQPVPPADEDLGNDIEAVTEAPAADFEAAVRGGRVRPWSAEMHAEYLDALLRRRVDPHARAARIAFSPLHGTGRTTVGDLLPRAGFELRFVEEQREADGAFPAVKFRIPNPEVPESMERVTALARDIGADMALTTDPDADRLGVVAPAAEGWRFLNGNEIAVVLAAYVMEARRERGILPERAFLVKTAVTTELLTRIAAAHGVQVVGDLLVGFKYVAGVLDAIESHGVYGDVRATPADFLFAAEESHGLLISADLRDKDAAGAALLLAELCARLRQRGVALGDHLADLYRRYGYAANTGYSLVADGIAGTELIARMMERLRTRPPERIGGGALKSVADHWDEGSFGRFRSATDRAARNLVRLRYTGDLSVAVRPSGTEPKIKLYVEKLFEARPAWDGGGFAVARRAMDDATQEATLAMVAALLDLVDVRLPRAALLLSPLVSLEQRTDFARRFLAELDARLKAPVVESAAELAAWADRRLAAYGIDPRDLVRFGVAEYLRAAALRPQSVAVARAVFALP